MVAAGHGHGPGGCTALISRFGKVEAEVGPGRVTLWNPWKRVSYIVNTTREYPFNAPIRSAPTKSGVQASVDLFLQFRIVSAREFVFVLGAVQGFQDKLNNAISETTRSLIYEQEPPASTTSSVRAPRGCSTSSTRSSPRRSS